MNHKRQSYELDDHLCGSTDHPSESALCDIPGVGFDRYLRMLLPKPRLRRNGAPSCLRWRQWMDCLDPLRRPTAVSLLMGLKKRAQGLRGEANSSGFKAQQEDQCRITANEEATAERLSQATETDSSSANPPSSHSNEAASAVPTDGERSSG